MRAAILFEDVFEVVLSDAEIDPAVFADASAVGGSGRPPPGNSLMCGICGIVSYGGPPDLALLRRMMGRLGHRGPDGNGYYRDRRAALGHTRLAIIDTIRRRPAPLQRGWHRVGDVQRGDLQLRRARRGTACIAVTPSGRRATPR